MAPVKGIQSRRRHAVWMDNDLKVMKTERDMCREAARMSGDDQDWSRFRTIRNKYNKELIKKKN